MLDSEPTDARRWPRRCARVAPGAGYMAAYHRRVVSPTPPLPVPDALTMKRLGYVRLLYQQAVSRSFAPSPLNFSAVLAFHDVCEYFFVIAVDYHHAVASNGSIDLAAKLADNLKKFKTPDGNGLANRQTLRRLTEYRNGFKHNGAIPNDDQVEHARQDATLFLESNCQALFGVAFSEASMLHVVPQDEVKEHLQLGRAAADAGNIASGMSELALAFSSLMRGWGPGKFVTLPSRHERFNLGGIHRFPRRNIQDQAGGRLSQNTDTQRLAGYVNQAFKDVDSEIDELRALAVVQMTGINMMGYIRLSMLLPRVVYSGSGERSTVPTGMEYHHTIENYDFCEEFIVDSALRMGRSDFQLWMPDTYGDAKRAGRMPAT